MALSMIPPAAHGWRDPAAGPWLPKTWQTCSKASSSSTGSGADAGWTKTIIFIFLSPLIGAPGILIPCWRRLNPLMFTVVTSLRGWPALGALAFAFCVVAVVTHALFEWGAQLGRRSGQVDTSARTLRSAKERGHR